MGPKDESKQVTEVIVLRVSVKERGWWRLRRKPLELS